MLSENEIAELLRDNQRDHTLTDDERARIRAALLSDSATARPLAGPGEADLVDVSVIPATRRRRPTRTPWLLAAAALLILVGVGVAVMGDDDRPLSTVAAPDEALTPAAVDPQTAPTTEPTTDPRTSGLEEGRALCAGPFAAFSDGIAAWDGIENWSYLTDPRDPEPHLPTLASELLDGLETVIGETAVTTARAELEAALAESEQFEGFTPAIRLEVVDALRAVVAGTRRAIEADLNSGFQRLSTCDLDGFTTDG